MLSAIRPLGGLRCTFCPPAEKDADLVSNGSPLNAGFFVPDNVAEAKPYRIRRADKTKYGAKTRPERRIFVPDDVAEAKPYRAYGEPTRRSMARKTSSVIRSLPQHSLYFSGREPSAFHLPQAGSLRPGLGTF